MTSAVVILALPKLSPITDNIAITLKILSIIMIKNYADNGNPIGKPLTMVDLTRVRIRIMVWVRFRARFWIRVRVSVVLSAVINVCPFLRS